MRLVKLDTPEGTIYINPEHVVAVVKGLRDTKVDTVSGVHVVKDSPRGRRPVARDGRDRAGCDAAGDQPRLTPGISRG